MKSSVQCDKRVYNTSVLIRLTCFDLGTHTNIKIAFKTTHIIDRALPEKHNTNPYEQSGLYKLTCHSCHQVHIGQTGRKLSTRYSEHIRNKADRKADKEEMEAYRKAEKNELLALMEANQAKTETRHKEMMADWKAWGEERRNTHEKIEPRSEAMQSILEHREVPVDDALRIPVGEPKERRRGPETGRGVPPPDSEGCNVGKSWAPQRIGRHKQKDILSRDSGTTEKRLQEGSSQGNLRMPAEEIGRRPRRDESPRESGTPDKGDRQKDVPPKNCLAQGKRG
jgi:hypothetical protein